MPISGEIVAVNEELGDAPELINQDAYVNWIVEVKPSDISQLENLLLVDAYQELLKG
ncbi:MAG: hypothetical protein GQ542_00475 [Desulforhopalus sp.]|nr:hypothetical protein [Desulforhopalus sp.]